MKCMYLKDLNELIAKRGNNHNERIDASSISLNGENLRDRFFENIDFSYANFEGADLTDAIFQNCDLTEATMCNAKCVGTHFVYTKFNDTEMSGADFYNAVFFKSDPDMGIYTWNTRGLVPVCPTEGEFIAWKIAYECIIKLRIPADARRSSGTNRKCRCDKAEVLSINRIWDGTPVDAVCSDYDPKFIYRVGCMVEEPEFSTDRWNICAPGIHFFMSRREAESYVEY